VLGALGGGQATPLGQDLEEGEADHLALDGFLVFAFAFGFAGFFGLGGFGGGGECFGHIFPDSFASMVAG